MEQFKKAYYLFFYKLYCLFRSLFEDGWEDWKAGLVIQTLQLFILIIVFLQIFILTSVDITFGINPKIWAIPLALFLAPFNYYVFLYKKGWKAFEKEFQNYSKQKNRMISLAVLGVIIGIFSLLIYSYYELSQIDWSEYRSKQ